MLYHSLGPSMQSKSKKKMMQYKSKLVYKNLEDEGIVLFKLIFDNNNSEL